MTTVLSRTLIGTGIVILLNTFAYAFLGRSMEKEGITVVSVLALFCAIPVILGYVLTYFLLTYNNIALYAVNIGLLVLNGLLIAGATILTIVVATEFPWILISFGYIFVGAYVYFETMKIIGQANRQQGKNDLSDGDLLDDGF